MRPESSLSQPIEAPFDDNYKPGILMGREFYVKWGCFEAPVEVKTEKEWGEVRSAP